MGEAYYARVGESPCGQQGAVTPEGGLRAGAKAEPYIYGRHSILAYSSGSYA